VDWLTVWGFRDAILHGYLVTLWLAAAVIVGATLLGSVLGCLATMPSFFLQRLTTTFTEVMRNLPAVVKVFFLYFVVGLPAYSALLTALILHQSAYISDITSAGIRSIARGQLDAGLSLGHGYLQTFRYIILPQVVRIVIPPLTTQHVAALKHTSVAGLIAIQELTFETQEVNVATFRGFEAATVATVLYVIAAMVIIGAMSLLHNRIKLR
jgi:polar amino acid transport system permease protein